jgi:hypothetical protein
LHIVHDKLSCLLRAIHMTKQFAVQSISRRALDSSISAGADESDLAWETVRGHGDYPDLRTAWEAAEEFDIEFDHRYAHRVIEVAVEPPAPAPVPVAAPAKRPILKRHMAEHKNQQSCARNLALLKHGLDLHWPRVHLDPLIELCAIYLLGAGSSVLTERYRAELAKAAEQVATRGNLRVVK